MLHSNVVEPKTRCCTLMCVNQCPNGTVLHGTPYRFNHFDVFMVKLFVQIDDDFKAWIYLDTRFYVNDAKYTWDDGTEIKLEEWLNAPNMDGNPVIPKWIVLR